MLTGAEPTDWRSAAAPPTGVPAPAEVMARADGENFPVASRVLPRAARADLLAIYGFARLVDELGDSYPGDRLAALDWLEGELDRAYRGAATHPLLVRLQPTLRRCSPERELFVRLIDANRVDQRVQRYESWGQLRAYCALSADPVGELVLCVLGLATPERVALSDSICTGLQLLEHCQDVAEDLAAGRVYLPADELERCGVTVAELGRPHASQPVRELIAFEIGRARTLFDEGAPLIGELSGRARVAVAGFLAGGRANAGAIEAAGYDVLGAAPRAGRIAIARELARALRAGRRARP